MPVPIYTQGRIAQAIIVRYASILDGYLTMTAFSFQRLEENTAAAKCEYNNISRAVDDAYNLGRINRYKIIKMLIFFVDQQSWAASNYLTQKSPWNFDT